MAKRDGPKALMRVDRGGLVPVAAYDAEVIGQYRNGSEVEVTLHQKRGDRLNRVYWWLLGIAVENQRQSGRHARFASARDLHNTIMMELGYVSTIQLMNGALYVQPRSLSELEAEEFKDYFQGAMTILEEEVVPGMDMDAVIKSKGSFFGPRWEK